MLYSKLTLAVLAALLCQANSSFNSSRHLQTETDISPEEPQPELDQEDQLTPGSTDLPQGSGESEPTPESIPESEAFPDEETPLPADEASVDAPLDEEADTGDPAPGQPQEENGTSVTEEELPPGEEEGCPEGYTTVFENLSESCEPCAEVCKTCYDDGQFDAQNRCVLCKESFPFKFEGTDYCTASCGEGYFEAVVNDSPVCSKCEPTCKTCAGFSGYCTSCPDETPFLVEQTCLTACPLGYIQEESQCLPCESSCSACDGEPTNCLTCVDSKFLFQNTCFDQCPQGSVPFAESNSDQLKCVQCAEDCLTCDSARPEICFTCGVGSAGEQLTLESGSCVVAAATEELEDNNSNDQQQDQETVSDPTSSTGTARANNTTDGSVTGSDGSSGTMLADKNANMNSVVTLIVGTVIVFITLFILTISKQIRLRQREATLDDKEADSKEQKNLDDPVKRNASQDSIGRINHLTVNDQSIRTRAAETANSVSFSVENFNSSSNKVASEKTPTSISVEPKMRQPAMDINETAAALYTTGPNSFTVDKPELNERTKIMASIMTGDDGENESERIKGNESILSGNNTIERNLMIVEENQKDPRQASAPALPDISGHKVENAAFALEPPGIDARRRSELSEQHLGEGPTLAVGSEIELDKEGHFSGQVAMQTIASHANTLDAPNQSIEEIRPPNLDETDK